MSDVSLDVLSAQLSGIDKLMAAEFRNVAEAIRAGDAGSRAAIQLVAEQVNNLRATVEALAATSATHPAYADQVASAVRTGLEKVMNDHKAEVDKRLDAHAEALKEHGEKLAGQTVRNAVIGAIGLASLSGVAGLLFTVFGGH